MNEGRKNITVVNTPGQSCDAMFFDGFEHGMFWNKSSANISGDVTIDNTQVYEGGNSLKLDTGATAPTADEYTTTYKYVALGRERYIEAIWKWMVDNPSNTTTINFSIQVQWQGRYQLYYFILDTVSSNIIYFDEFGAPVTINVDPFEISGYIWYNWRLVIDRAGKQYVSIDIGSTHYKILANTNDANAGSYSENCYVLALIQTKDNSRKQMWIDNVTVRGIDQP